MKITREEGRSIICNDHKDWEEVRGTRHMGDTSRWSNHYSAVFKHEPSGKHYELGWSVGATEQQEERPFDYDDPDPVEVVAKEAVTTTWVPI